jgi:hypothetical protein
LGIEITFRVVAQFGFPQVKEPGSGSGSGCQQQVKTLNALYHDIYECLTT